MRTWITIVSFLCTLALAIHLTSYVARLPESNCTTTQVGSSASDDHVYTAALLKKECNMAETTFYSVRIDKAEQPPDRGWFTREELEQDPYPALAIEPTMTWEAHRLEITIPANELAGSIQRRIDDLTIVRSYVRPKAK